MTFDEAASLHEKDAVRHRSTGDRGRVVQVANGRCRVKWNGTLGSDWFYVNEAAELLDLVAESE